MKTLKHISTYNLLIKKSKFICFAYPVTSKEQVADILKEIEQKYHDAKHIVYAYKIGDNIIKKENSSEPANTAGTPILCAIENNNLTNVLVVVIRYFGGVLLGASNLYRAYSDVALEAIKANEVVELNKYKRYNVNVSYVQYASINSLANKSDEIRILNGDFDREIKVDIAVKENATNPVILNIISGQKPMEELWL